MVTTYSNRRGSLLSSTTLVEAPFIRVDIGGYVFGVYNEKIMGTNSEGVLKAIGTKFPNYVQSLKVKKINGTVNQYELVIKYPLTPETDPNFFEKIFSSISETRKIRLDYGDFMAPSYIYRDEEAIITDVTTSFDLRNNVIQYTVSAVSTAKLTLSGCYNFGGLRDKPSNEIFRVLYNDQYNLLKVFTGMADRSFVEQNSFIARNDKAVNIPCCVNISALDYISTLVSYMTPTDSEGSSLYSLTTYDDTNSTVGGPYFKVQGVSSKSQALKDLCTYEVDIGYPTANMITSFNIKNTSSWAIYYNYDKSLDNNSEYTKKINDKGEIEFEYSPLLTGSKFSSDAATQNWWNKVTSFPISAEIEIRGLLRPAILMQYLKLNVWSFGHKHTSSGYYIITSQEDSISTNGYITTLGLTRVAGDEELI